ncbi:ATP-binding protein [Variovorax sp. OV700]|uniref:ATP-binding protein n=1 Tax=Variovorax sp. OV700 TaxID=1882826 RepID=UPI000889B4A1|nr:ATP-binding protein [Variovorax sp. OV700]SDI19249.1 Protein of unknown function [Variovorax sp. OV700]
MTYRLCRTLLVNAGTNQRVPSARITAIDPRGGAAVLGDNGVGKTSTLQIVPLFFGHPPSQIVSAGQGNLPMIRFLLPTDASAIAFEYQRGPNETDMRLAVIRRRADDPDTPFYRFYNCGFIKDLFVRDGRFLSDDETQLRATELDIPTSSKLSTAEYRSVILRVPSNTKEKDRLRRFSLEWSYGPKPLDNLDRLVAAMVKKHVKFSDIVQVAVGLAQQDIGQGSERSRLAFRQGRAPIERWMRNRDAVAEAFRLEGQIGDLGLDLKEHRAAESRFRARRADLEFIRQARAAERVEVVRTIESLEVKRRSDLEREEFERSEISEASKVATKRSIDSKEAYDQAEATSELFEKERAGYWESKIEELPTLRLSRQNAMRQAAAAEAAHASVTSRYEALEQELRMRTAARSLEIETSKQPHRVRLAQALAQINESEEGAKTQASALRDAQRETLSAAKEPLLELRGAWQSRVREPAASQQALNELQQANEKRHRHTDSRSAIVQSLAAAKAKDLEAKRSGMQLDGEIRAEQSRLQELIAAADEARLRLNPQPGSLLAKLHAHDDETWRRDLAKVIDVSLLHREDLDPHFMEESSRTLYGWGLRTSAIASPEWVHNESAKRLVEEAEARVGASRAHLEMLQTRVATVSRAQKDAELAVQVAESGLSIHDAKTEEINAGFERATHRVESERSGSKTTAQAELDRLASELRAIEQQLVGLNHAHANDIEQIRQAHQAQRKAAQEAHDASISVIDESLKSLAADADRQAKEIEAQLAEHLSEQGVDPARLFALKKDADAINELVDELEAKESLVGRWRKWQAAGGSVRVQQLQAAARRDHEAARTAVEKLATFEQAAAEAKRAHDELTSAKEKRREDIDDELVTLEGLDEEFGSYQAVGVSAIDPHTTARELRGRVHAELQAITKLQTGITSTTGRLLTAMTAKDSAVRDLLEASMTGTGEGPIARAQELVTAYRLIGPQVATDVNRTLAALLANIGAFRKAITNFENEVKLFNERLGTGLRAVRFARIKDLHVDLVTNFDTLGFYKKLQRMDEVARQHASEYGRDPSRDLPSDDVTQAIGAFLSVLGSDGTLEVNLASHINLRGRVTDNGVPKVFMRESEFESISSTGLTTLIKVTLMTGLLNTIRDNETVYIPWVTDEVGTIDGGNFVALMQMLRDNWIDVMTASPDLGPTQHALFARRYLFEDRGRVREYVPAGSLHSSQAADSTSINAGGDIEVMQ